MQTRRLGSQGLAVSMEGLGCMGMSEFYGATDDEESLATIRGSDSGSAATPIRELAIGFVPYSPLGRGFLSGRFSSPDDIPEGDFCRANPRFQGENFERNMRIVERVRELADERRVTPAQLALAWVMAQGDDVVPIPGTKRRSYLEENVAATEISLSDNDLKRLDEAAPPGPTAGERYPDMSSIDR